MRLLSPDSHVAVPSIVALRSLPSRFEGDPHMLTAAPPITMTGMELTFRRDMPGFKGARHFMLEPLGEGAAGIFARLRCTDTVYVQGTVPMLLV